MRHRTAACVLAALIGVGLMWPTEAAAQRRSHTRGVTRAVPATRVVRVRPAYYRYYYPYSYSLYWGWGYPWYSYPYFYGPYGYPGYPYGYGGPWGYRYYDDYASVRVLASPRDAQVYVDGYFVGVVDDFDGVFQRLRVPPGGHEITLHLNGKTTGQKQFAISLAGPGLIAVAAGPRAWLNRRALVPLAAAFLAGGAPWWVENLRNGFLSLRARELAPAPPGRRRYRVPRRLQAHRDPDGRLD